MRTFLAVVLGLALGFSSTDPSFPPELDRVVVYKSGGTGHGAFLHGDRFLTAAHMVDGGLGGFIDPRTGKIHPLEMLLWRGKKKEDLALLLVRGVDVSDLALVLSKEVPKRGEDVFYVCAAPVLDEKGQLNWDHTFPLYLKARVAGRDGEILYTDGWQAAGCSGTPLLNRKGEIVAVHSGAFYWYSNMEQRFMTSPLGSWTLTQKLR